MAVLFQNSSKNWTLSVKILLISSCFLSTAVMLKLSVPVGIKEFAVSEWPLIWSFFVSCLKPPYLYLLFNSIIATIVASSRLQQSKVVANSPDVLTTKKAEYPAVDGGFVMKNENVEEVLRPEFQSLHCDPKVIKASNSEIESFYTSKVMDALKFDAYSHVEVEEAGVRAPKTPVVKSVDGYVMFESSWKSQNPYLSSDYYSSSADKPLVSTRLGHRKSVKASIPEGDRIWRLAKPKRQGRQETLESTWKTTTEGCPMPSTRHFRKSDTWETRRHHDHVDGGVDQQEKMIKSETFNERRSIKKSSPCSGKLRKEPSLSTDEVNRRVEAFIKKFNEDMKLQSQESLNQYMEMTNRGAH